VEDAIKASKTGSETQRRAIKDFHARRLDMNYYAKVDASKSNKQKIRKAARQAVPDYELNL